MQAGTFLNADQRTRDVRQCWPTHGTKDVEVLPDLAKECGFVVRLFIGRGDLSGGQRLSRDRVPWISGDDVGSCQPAR